MASFRDIHLSSSGRAAPSLPARSLCNLIKYIDFPLSHNGEVLEMPESSDVSSGDLQASGGAWQDSVTWPAGGRAAGAAEDPLEGV